MKELWRRSTALLWANPSIWIPVLFADLIATAVKTENGALNHQITLSLIQSQHASVLTRSQDIAVSAAEAALLVAAVDLGTQLITVVLYAIAAVITWSLVQTLVVEPKPELAPTIRSAGSRGWQIFGLALLAFGLAVCLTLLPTLLLGIALPFLHLALMDRMIVIHAIGMGSQTLAYVLAAYWVVPSAVRLIQPKQHTPIAQHTLNGARLFAVFAVITSLAIGFLCQTLERTLPVFKSPAHSGVGVAIGAAASLLSAIPYVVLFIFLSLAAENETEKISSDGTPVTEGSTAPLFGKYGDSSLRSD